MQQLIECPVCGLAYLSGYGPDERQHNRYHDKILAARERFGPLQLYVDRENAKFEAYEVLQSDKAYTIQEKLDAAHKMLWAYFSRSVQAAVKANEEDTHPFFKEYTAMLLNQTAWKNRLNSDVYQALVQEYGTAAGIPDGSTYYHA